MKYGLKLLNSIKACVNCEDNFFAKVCPLSKVATLSLRREKFLKGGSHYDKWNGKVV
jgi:hypothetical protein